MRQAGEVTYTNCHDNRFIPSIFLLKSQNSFFCRTGEGVAEFASRSDMEYALDKLDGAELGGRRWLCPDDHLKT